MLPRRLPSTFDPKHLRALTPATQADLTVANLESPLTASIARRRRSQRARGEPAGRRTCWRSRLRRVDRDNHAGDAGPATVTDTRRCAAAADLRAIGGGHDANEAITPRSSRRRAHGGAPRVRRVGGGPRGTLGSVARGGTRRRARRRARCSRRAPTSWPSSLHGGRVQPGGRRVPDASSRAASPRWGADIVWCHGPHVVQPVRRDRPRPRRSDRRSSRQASATCVFDQQGIPGTRSRRPPRGARRSRTASRAFRVGSDVDRRGARDVRRLARSPAGTRSRSTASWWACSSGAQSTARRSPRSDALVPGCGWVVIDAALGDVERDGRRRDRRVVPRPFSPGSHIERAALAPMRCRQRRMKAVRRASTGATTCDRCGSRPASCVLWPRVDALRCRAGRRLFHPDDPTVVATGALAVARVRFTSSVDLPGAGIARLPRRRRRRDRSTPS